MQLLVKTTSEPHFLNVTQTNLGTWTWRNMASSVRRQTLTLTQLQLPKIKSRTKSKEPVIYKNFLSTAMFRVSGGPIQEPKRISDMNNAEIVFSLFDDNRDGYVTSKEMMKKSKNLTPDQVDKVSC